MRNTKKLTFAALATALSVVLLYIASLVTTGTLAFQYVAGLVLMLAVSRSGIFYGIACYIATALLLLVLLPDKSNAISYAVFFGSIPVIKFFAEKRCRMVEWIIKIVFMNICIGALYLIFRSVLTTTFHPILLWVVALITAVGYDLLLSMGFSYAQRYFKKTP